MHGLLGDDAGDGCALKRHDTTLATSSGEEIGLLQITRACVAAPDRGGLDDALSTCWASAGTTEAIARLKIAQSFRRHV
jgi:hypothetical protein